MSDEWPEALERGVAGAPLEGHERSGDLAVFVGALGYSLPRVKPHTVPISPGDAVVFVTDGIESDFSGVLSGGVPAQELAERVYARHGKGTDDALAVVVRYAP